MRTPRAAAVSQTRRITEASPAWNPQATLALVTQVSSASSSVRVQRPNPSPRSALRSITSGAAARAAPWSVRYAASVTAAK